jgi:hypothetical protein
MEYRSRWLLVASLLFLLAGVARADIPPGPPPKPSPDRAPEPAREPARKACGAGMGLLVLGIGAYGAWRLSKTRPAGGPVPRGVV